MTVVAAKPREAYASTILGRGITTPRVSTKQLDARIDPHGAK